MAQHWYSEGAKGARQAAGQGDVRAQEIIARLYLDGKGVPADREEAITWFNTAALQGHLGAQVRLARVFDNGSDSAPRSAPLAARYYQMAADQGQPARSTRSARCTPQRTAWRATRRPPRICC